MASAAARTRPVAPAIKATNAARRLVMACSVHGLDDRREARRRGRRTRRSPGRRLRLSTPRCEGSRRRRLVAAQPARRRRARDRGRQRRAGAPLGLAWRPSLPRRPWSTSPSSRLLAASGPTAFCTAYPRPSRADAHVAIAAVGPHGVGRGVRDRSGLRDATGRHAPPAPWRARSATRACIPACTIRATSSRALCSARPSRKRRRTRSIDGRRRIPNPATVAGSGRRSKRVSLTVTCVPARLGWRRLD